jgi:hypothetical protein
MRSGRDFAFCSDCGARITLSTLNEPIRLTSSQRQEVDEQRMGAALRTRFEQALFQLHSWITEQRIKPPECFISYACGNDEHERWVERRLATDLQKAGVPVLLDRWHNAQIGASVSRFIGLIERCDRVIVVGTPAYRLKYDNLVSEAGSVVAAEVDLISQRLMGTQERKRTVVPLLRLGRKETSLPPLMHDQVHADFRDERAYFSTMFDLILSLYRISVNAPAVADLRLMLRD